MNIQHLMGDCFCHETLHEKILMELNEFLLTSIEHVGNGVGVQEFAEEGQVLGVKELNLHLVQDLFALKAIDVLFDQMMRNHEERHKFHEFCKLENSEENFLFLEAIEKYRSLRSVHERALFQHEIVEKFLRETGSHPLNLSGKVLQSELLLIEKSCGDMSAFDKLETEVRVMTITDTFIRFNSSPRSLNRSE